MRGVLGYLRMVTTEALHIPDALLSAKAVGLKVGYTAEWVHANLAHCARYSTKSGRRRWAWSDVVAEMALEQETAKQEAGDARIAELLANNGAGMRDVLKQLRAAS